MKAILFPLSFLGAISLSLPCPGQVNNCEGCLVGTITCNAPVRGRLDSSDCLTGVNRIEAWRFELEARATVLGELAAPSFPRRPRPSSSSTTLGRHAAYVLSSPRCTDGKTV